MIRTALLSTRYRQKSPQVSEFNFVGVFWLTILHIGLALVIDNFRFAATIHALLVFAFGVWTALSSEDIRNVIPYVAYIAGAEVLWRMSKAGIFWEFGKYATIAILVFALIRSKKRLKKPWLPILYFLLFIPSAFLTINALGWGEIGRETISFNLSGPLATSVCLLFFFQVMLDDEILTRTIWAAVYPIVGILTLAVYSTLTSTTIYFGTESVFATSGGYGPNQVSTLLGLGALFLTLWIIQTNKKGGRFLSIVLILGLVIQSFLTFSRGGVYNLAIALAAALVVLLFRPNKFIRSFSVTFFLLVVIGYFIFPRLEEMTAGALSRRFQNTDPSSRISLASADLRLFADNPIAGVGPGMAAYRREFMDYAAAHTEYTRALAEHGSFGILALILLGLQLVTAFFKAPDAVTRAWVIAFAAWSMVEMAHAAMRIVAISLMLGLAVANWYREDDQPPLLEKKAK